MTWQRGQSGHPIGRYSTESMITKAMPLILDNHVDRVLDSDPVAGAAVIS